MKVYTKVLLEKVAYQPEGAWNNDPVKFKGNVIKWMQEKVIEALEYEAIESKEVRTK